MSYSGYDLGLVDEENRSEVRDNPPEEGTGRGVFCQTRFITIYSIWTSSSASGNLTNTMDNFAIWGSIPITK